MNGRTQLTERYWLVRDPWQMWIEKECVNAKTGKTHMERATGYYHSYSALLEDFAERRIRNAEGKIVKDLLAELKAEEDTILEMARILQDIK